MALKKKDILDNAQKGGQIRLNNLSDLTDVYRDFDRPMAKIVLDGKTAYVSFETIRNIQFIVPNVKSTLQLEFIEEKKIINLNKSRQGFLKFLLLEFWQGRNLLRKLFHLIYTLCVIVIFNILFLKFGTDKNLQMVFTGILSAVSIFIAVFSIFVANNEQFKEKKHLLFERGKLAYYFSVDKNITMCGLISIFASLGGVLIVGDNNTSFSSVFYSNNWRDILSISAIELYFLNISFITLFITLRSLIEFYVIRPGKFMIGEMKDEFLKKY